jgi:hypothetical protein
VKEFRFARFRIWHLFVLISAIAIGSAVYRSSVRHQPSDFFLRFHPEQFLNSCVTPQTEVDEVWVHLINESYYPGIKIDGKDCFFRVSEIGEIKSDLMSNARIAVLDKLTKFFAPRGSNLNISHIGVLSGDSNVESFVVDYDMGSCHGTIRSQRVRISSHESYVYIQLFEWRY